MFSNFLKTVVKKFVYSAFCTVLSVQDIKYHFTCDELNLFQNLETFHYLGQSIQEWTK